MGLTLEQIRQQFNIPKNVSDNEVVRIAQENNIFIDFAGSMSTESYSAYNLNNLGNSIFRTQSTNNYSQTSSDNNIFSGFSTQNNTSKYQMQDYSFNTSAYDMNKTLNENKNQFTSSFGNLISESISLGNTRYKEIQNAKSSLLKGKNIVDQTRVIRTEFGENGKIIQTLDNNEQVTIQLDPEKLPNHGKIGKYSKVEFVDGQVLYYDKEGNLLQDKTRAAKYGEHGYVKSGNSIQEELQLKVGKKYDKLNQIRADIENAKNNLEQLKAQKDSALQNKTELQNKINAIGAEDPERADLEQQLKNVDKEIEAEDKAIKNAEKDIANLEKKEKESTDDVFKNYVGKIIKECNGDVNLLNQKMNELQNNSDLSLKDTAYINNMIGQVKDKWKSGEITQEMITDWYANMLEHSDDEATSQIAGATTNYIAENGDKTLIHAFADAAKKVGLEKEVAVEIGKAIVQNKFHGKEEALEALRAQYGLSAEQANEYYKNLPEEVRQKIEDKTLDSMTTVQAEVAADQSQPEKVRQDAADLSTEYATYIDNAQYQMQVIQNNNNYIMQNADDDMKEYYNNSVANNAYNYDISNREDVIRMVQEQGTEKTLEILENARKESEAQDLNNKAAAELLKSQKEMFDQKNNEQQQVKQNVKTEQTQPDKQLSTESEKVSSPKGVTSLLNLQTTDKNKLNVPSGVSKVQSYILSSDFKTSDVRSKVEYVQKLNPNERKQAISAIVDTSQPMELVKLMYTGMKHDILKFLVNHPNPKNDATILYLQGFLSSEDKKFVKECETERLRSMGQSNIKIKEEVEKRNPFDIMKK